MTEITFRWSGILLAAGAALLGVAIVIVALKPVINPVLSPEISRLLLLASVFLLLSLPAMYIRQADAAGWLGLVGHILLQTGVLLLVLLAATPILYPALQTPTGENLVVFLLGIALTMGLLMTGIATTQAHVYPRWTGILLLAAMAGFFFDFFVAEYLPPLAGQLGTAIFGVLLASALAGIGISLWTGKAGLVIGKLIQAS
jgi:hypothetical protein